MLNVNLIGGSSDSTKLISTRQASGQKLQKLGSFFIAYLTTLFLPQNVDERMSIIDEI
jgi:hypothetical protein